MFLRIKNFIKNNWQILIAELFLLASFFVFWGKFGDVMVDSFREIYIPLQMVDGNIIYKDIFVIYPPLSYLINAFLIKIFGNEINVLQTTGLLTSAGILYFTNKIAEIFLEKKYIFAILLFIISGLILSPNVFNSFLPYSFGILYGILFVLISIYCALDKKNPLSYLFYSLAILCKFEFALLLPALIFISKKSNWKRNLLALIVPFLITGIVLAMMGVNLSDLKKAFNLIQAISTSKILYIFYSYMGLTFQLELFPVYLANFIKFLIPINLLDSHYVLAWSFPAILISFIFRFKQLEYKEKFFIIASLLVSIKVFFALVLGSYGAYYLPLALISLFILIPKNYRKVFLVLLILWSLMIGFTNIKDLKTKKLKFNKVNEYILQNTTEKDQVVIYPECLNINVLTNRKSDNKMYSLIPLYVETFGEDNIIRRLESSKPNYIIINNYDTSLYYYKEFGKDYAINIYNWIEEYYTLETVIEDKWMFKVYRLK